MENLNYPNPNHQKWNHYVGREALAPLFGCPLRSPDTIPIDLSRHNQKLRRISHEDTRRLGEYIFGEMQRAHAAFGIGGYDEDRALYGRFPLYCDGDETRSIHLGVDIWARAGTPIFCPVTGTVHSFQDNKQSGDYGPTIILQHQSGDLTWYSLYGHLSTQSLSGLCEGQRFHAGERLAAIGAPRNGEWPPHLHFQIMLDLLGCRGDFPAVATQARRAEFLNICPDPERILHL
jgi:murein DD-endopeptidase MepM/ murein hydrolase activator NlpD